MLTVRNGGDIVEAYEFEVVGACAPWTTVEPARLSLYPGTSETVRIVLRPPRSSEVPVGEIPLAVLVTPAERPETRAVPEATVVVRAFRELTAELVPQVRRARRRARHLVVARNRGNTPLLIAPDDLRFVDGEEQLRFATTSAPTTLDAGASAEIALRVSARRLRWFGRPVVRPFQAVVTASDPPSTTEAADTAETIVETADAAEPVDAQPTSVTMDGQFVHLAVLPRWLLWLLGALLALLLLWFGLVRPAVQSAAREAARERTEEMAEAGEIPQAPPGPDAGDESSPGTGGDPDSEADSGSETDGRPGGSEDGDDGRGPGLGEGEQLSVTIEVETDEGDVETGVHTVAADRLFRVTDVLVSNFQGDEGIVTITFDETVVATIALETFRNQDYHWVTPIDVPESADIAVRVECDQPGTPASGEQAAGCVELVHVNGSVVILDD
ncbi:hypothetical protein UA75_21345 [Actinoalloteichus sp. GBA129-24]|uniref:Hydrolytic protein n=2 Tax=Pseudonocardiaceae TaxID=2070 RepID=A0AAC9LF17_9PSEU|nr:hypothetical protein UA74_20855 [Actinoalloteichus fjordicus]APU22258.1 hypothetical protein UA75_21345 [Actinoalloteichus sp. GBA129-24]